MKYFQSVERESFQVNGFAGWGRRAAVFGDYCATEGHLKGPSRGLPENGMKPKFARAQPECLERGIAGLRPASGGPRVTTIVAETRKSDFNLQI